MYFVYVFFWVYIYKIRNVDVDVAAAFSLNMHARSTERCLKKEKKKWKKIICAYIIKSMCVYFGDDKKNRW